MNTIKQKYVPCELSVVEFKVERGFAVSGNSFIGDPTYDEQQSTAITTMTWSMNVGNNSSNFQNEKYGRVDNWFN